jgi:hypothetical protein
MAKWPLAGMADACRIARVPARKCKHSARREIEEAIRSTSTSV